MPRFLLPTCIKLHDCRWLLTVFSNRRWKQHEPFEKLEGEREEQRLPLRAFHSGFSLLSAEEKFSQTIPRRLLVSHRSFVGHKTFIIMEAKKATILTKKNRRAVLGLVCCEIPGLGSWGLDGPEPSGGRTMIIDYG